MGEKLEPPQRSFKRIVHPPRRNHPAQREGLEAYNQRVGVFGSAFQPLGEHSQVAGLIEVGECAAPESSRPA